MQYNTGATISGQVY